MPKLSAYDKELPYSYALGIFPATECLKHAADRCMRLLVSADSAESEGVLRLREAAEAAGIRCEEAGRLLEKISRKENCHAAMVFEKAESRLCGDGDHLVLYHPSDMGNLGTILRTALGFGYRDIAIIRPAADSDDPRVVRASMGAVFSLSVCHYDTFEAYRAAFPEHRLYPFMLTGSTPLDEAAASRAERCALVMGNEATGLPEEFARYGTPVRIPHSGDIDSLNLAIAAGIGMYAFGRQREGGCA